MKKRAQDAEKIRQKWSLFKQFQKGLFNGNAPNLVSPITVESPIMDIMVKHSIIIDCILVLGRYIV